MLLWIAAFLTGVALLIFCSERFVEHAVALATLLKIPAFLLGVTLAAIGTDLPEIANSIISSYLGHGDVVIGDVLGSVLVQMTLVPAIIGFFRQFRLRRDEVIVGGCSLLLALMFFLPVMQDGFVSRTDAAGLIAFWVLLMILSSELLLRRIKERAVRKEEAAFHLALSLLYMIGIAIGGFLAVNGIIYISQELGVPELVMSFLVFSIGTSLPELTFDLIAVRKREYELAVGDFIGSSIIDAGLATGVGSLLFPIGLTSSLALQAGSLVLVACALVIALLSLGKRLDRKVGMGLVSIYLLFIYLMHS